MIDIKQVLDTIIQGNTFEVLKEFPPQSVDCIMFSPPYWSLRYYKIEDVEIDGWKGQFGLEQHPQQYVDHMVYLCKLLKPILKNEGSMWINIGDCYYTKSGSNYAGSTEQFTQHAQKVGLPIGNQLRELFKSNWLQSKQLLCIPERIITRLQDEQGWILRNKVIWYKTNAVPDSVKDRLRVTWEYLYHLVKQDKYYYDLDSIREPYEEASKERYKYAIVNISIKEKEAQEAKMKMEAQKKGYSEHSASRTITGLHKPKYLKMHPLGKNVGDMWSIPTSSSFYRGIKHSATYPEQLCIKPVLATCPVGTGIVLDPFIGSGTTAVVAKNLHRHFIGIELNKEYIEIAMKRINNEKIEVKQEQIKIPTCPKCGHPLRLIRKTLCCTNLNCNYIQKV
jgi:DNA modification methylase